MSDEDAIAMKKPREATAKAGRRRGVLRARLSGAAGRLAPCASCTASTKQSVKRVAERLGVDPDALHRILHAMPMAESIALRRVNKVTTGLERELGGVDILRKWAHTPIMAFDNRKPVDVLGEGRVEPLERLQAMLKSGVYS